MSEKPVEGGVLGPLFACLVGHQFQNLKRGDRFYYENQDDTGFSAGNNWEKKYELKQIPFFFV